MALSLRHARRPIAALAAIAALTALAACGGDEAASDEEEQRANFEDAQVEFTQCMRENGIDLPDPEPGQAGIQIGPGDDIDIDSEEFQAAQEECGPIIEDALPEGERPDPAEVRDQLHVMTECLRDKGYDVPEPQIRVAGEDDPPPSEGPDPGESREDLERLMDDPEFQQAQEDCRDEAGLEEFGPGGGPDGE
jgi:hypothetical protein